MNFTCNLVSLQQFLAKVFYSFMCRLFN